MRDNHSQIAVILDRSGSMEQIRAATIDGFNEFLGQQKAAPGTADLHLVQFDDQYEPLYDKPLSECQPLTTETFVPRGATALMDALGRTIVTLGSKFEKLPEAARPSKVIVAIMTDGLENASQEYTAGRIREMISHQREKYNWEFVFLGAGQDAVLEGAKYGIPASHALTYAAAPLAARNALRAAGAMAVSARTAQRAKRGFSESDRQDAMKKEP
jgi:hypothetical protein